MPWPRLESSSFPTTDLDLVEFIRGNQLENLFELDDNLQGNHASAWEELYNRLRDKGIEPDRLTNQKDYRLSALHFMVSFALTQSHPEVSDRFFGMALSKFNVVVPQYASDDRKQHGGGEYAPIQTFNLGGRRKYRKRSGGGFYI